MEDEEDNMNGSKTIVDLQDTSTFSTRANNIDENSPNITSVSFEGTYDESNLLDNFYTAVKQGNLSLTKHFLNAILDQNKLSESFHRNVRKKEKSQTENENGQCNFVSELDVEKVFHIAAYKKHVPILQFLLKSLPFNNITTGSMLLEQALQLQNALLVKLVLDRGVSANEKVNGSYIRWGSFVMYTFPLHVATIAGDEEIVHMLICYGAQLDMCDTDGNTALMLACAGSNINVLRLLLKAGADINLTDFNDRSALVIAAALNKTDMISLIADHGGQISERMILRACEISSVSVFALKLLLRTLPNKGLYVDWYRLLDAATPFRKPEIVHELLNHMPASLKVPGKRAQDILINALRNKHHGEQITFTLLRENFIKVNIKNSEGEYPLHIAVQYCTFTLCSALASTFNADVNAKDKSGRTPLMMCLYRRRLEKDSTLTAASIMRHLIQQGADINAQDYEGRTSLHHAVMHDNQNAAAILIKAGAHVSICDEQGRSPLDIHWEDTFLCHSPIKNLGFLSGLNSNYFVKISLEKRMQIVTVLLEAGAVFENDVCQSWVLCTLLYIKLDQFIPLIIGKGVFPQQAVLCTERLGETSIDINPDIICIPDSKITAFNFALCMLNFETALYLYNNWFLTGADIDMLNKNNNIRHHIIKQISGKPEKMQQLCKSLFLNCKSLQLLSFVRVSDLIGPGKRRKERLKSSGLPPYMQRKLLYLNLER